MNTDVDIANNNKIANNRILTNITVPCSLSKLLEIFYLFRYHALIGDFVDHVLDSKYFGGKCEYVYNGEWRKFTYDSFCENLHYNEEEKNYRKPYNYHAYRFVVRNCISVFHLLVKVISFALRVDILLYIS